jgi:hypothetical protein
MKARLLLLTLCTAMSSVSCFSVPSFLISNRRTVPSEEKLFVLDGKCIVTLKYNANGTIREVTAVSADPNDTNSCGTTDKDLQPYGIVDNAGGITFSFENPQASAGRAAVASAASSGSVAPAGGRMICYGPPIPSPPRCVCTMNPCPQ